MKARRLLTNRQITDAPGTHQRPGAATLLRPLRTRRTKAPHSHDDKNPFHLSKSSRRQVRRAQHRMRIPRAVKPLSLGPDTEIKTKPKYLKLKQNTNQ
jgi:hypothetical protein